MTEQDQYRQFQARKRPSDPDVYGDDGMKKRRLDRPTDIDAPPATLRILVRNQAAGGVIGKGGDNIKRLRKQSSFHFSRKSVPETIELRYDCQVVLPDSAGAPERVMTMMGSIEGCVGVLGDVLPQLGEGIAQEGSTMMEVQVLIPQPFMGTIIGTGGAKIKELRSQTRCTIKIFTEPMPNSNERSIQLMGTVDQIQQCVHHFLDEISKKEPREPIFLYEPGSHPHPFVEGGGRGMPSSRGRGGGPPFRGGRGRGGGGFGGDQWTPRGGMRGGVRPQGGARGGFQGGRGGSAPGVSPNSGGWTGPSQAPSYGSTLPPLVPGLMAQTTHPTQQQYGVNNMAGQTQPASSGYTSGVPPVGYGMNQATVGYSANQPNTAQAPSVPPTNLMGNAVPPMYMPMPLIPQATPTSQHYAPAQQAAPPQQQHTTQQVTIPFEYAEAILGVNGVNLQQIKAQSSCDITINTPKPGSQETIITIVGTPNGIQFAQQLMQNSVRQHHPNV